MKMKKTETSSLIDNDQLISVIEADSRKTTGEIAAEWEVDFSTIARHLK